MKGSWPFKVVCSNEKLEYKSPLSRGEVGPDRAFSLRKLQTSAGKSGKNLLTELLTEDMLVLSHVVKAGETDC